MTRSAYSRRSEWSIGVGSARSRLYFLTSAGCNTPELHTIYSNFSFLRYERTSRAHSDAVRPFVSPHFVIMLVTYTTGARDARTASAKPRTSRLGRIEVYR